MEYVSIEKSRAGYQPGASAGAPAPKLKGKALDEAVEAAGLPKTGTADEKRAALAALAAGTPVAPTTSADPAANTSNPDGGTPVSKPEEG